MAEYYNVTTNLGDAEIAAAITNNAKIQITHIAFGDGAGSVPTPSKTRTTLVREVHRQAVTKYERHPTNPNWIVIETIIPSDIGGFTIREMGIIGNGKLISHGSHAPFEKVADPSGVSEYRLKFTQNITDGNVVSITLDDSLIFATQAWVEENFIKRSDIIDNLTTTDATKPVSAKQAKVLNDKVESIEFGAGGLKDKVEKTDPRLSDSREWTAETVSQAEAEIGTATTRRAWTAQRVRQAATAMFNAVTTTFTRTLLSRSTAAQARQDLELGTAATKDVMTSQVDLKKGSIMTLGAFGIGDYVPQAMFSSVKQSGLWGASSLEPNPYPFAEFGSSVRINRNPSTFSELFLPYSTGDRATSVGVHSYYEGISTYQVLYSSQNPIIYNTLFATSDRLVTVAATGEMRSTGFTIDTNGFIKNASPIVQLFTDKIELNDEAQQQNIEFEKLSVGDYLIKNSTGFAQDGWYIEQPRDANGNIYHAVVHEQLESGDISIRTYECKLNEIGQTVADLEKPIDIKENRFITLRLNELPQDTTAPQNPNVVDSDDKPAPSKYHYLENGEWKITAENKVILENERYAAYQASLRPLTRRQFKLALLENGLLDQIENSISAIEDDQTRARIQIEYAEATEFHRTSDSVAYMCQLLGLNDEQVDQMWEQALTL